MGRPLPFLGFPFLMGRRPGAPPPSPSECNGSGPTFLFFPSPEKKIWSIGGKIMPTLKRLKPPATPLPPCPSLNGGPPMALDLFLPFRASIEKRQGLPFLFCRGRVREEEETDEPYPPPFLFSLHRFERVGSRVVLSPSRPESAHTVPFLSLPRLRCELLNHCQGGCFPLFLYSLTESQRTIFFFLPPLQIVLAFFFLTLLPWVSRARKFQSRWTLFFFLPLPSNAKSAMVRGLLPFPSPWSCPFCGHCAPGERSNMNLLPFPLFMLPQ